MRETTDYGERQFAILTCMDARLDPAKYAGLAEGGAHRLVPANIPVYGYIYDVATGSPVVVPEATKLGKAA